MSHRTTIRLLFTGAGLAALVTPAASAASGPRPSSLTRLATCDELAGVTAAVNDRWRLFYTNPGEIEPGLYGCLRGAGPAKRVLSSSFYRVPQLVGDLVQLNNSGRYTSEGLVADLSTRRYKVLYSDYPATRSSLLPSGAILSLPERAVRPDDPIQPAPRLPNVGAAQWGDLTVTDAAGSRILTSGPSAPDGATLAASVAPFGHPGGPVTGLYATASDGTLQRHTTVGPASTADLTGRLQANWRRTRERIRTTAGRTTTILPDTSAQLDTQRASRGRPATLTLRRGIDEASGLRRKKPLLVARLVPGSAAELQTLPGDVIVGRFADRPTERRLRIVDPSRPGRFLLDLLAPASFDRDAFARAPTGELAFRDESTITLLSWNRATRSYDRRGAPAPSGARDFAFAPIPYGTKAPLRLLYTDGTGAPVALPFSWR